MSQVRTGTPDELRVSRRAFTDASAQVGMPADVQERMWAVLARSGPAVSGRLGLQSVAWYGGAAVSLAAMGLFLGTSWATVGSGAGLLLTLLYVAVFVGVCEVLRARGHLVPAGLLAATVVALVPLVVFAAQATFDVWPARDPGAYEQYDDFFAYVSGQWAVMELSTLAVAVVVWRRYRTAFLLLPVTVVGWFATMDLAAAVTGDFAPLALSLTVTAVLLGLGFAADRAGLRAEGFWLHLSGLLSLSWVLSTVDVSGGARAALTGLAGATAVAAGVWLRRRLHLTFGAAFVFGALSYLAFDVFGGSPVFALVLGAIGVGIVLAGIRLDRTTRPAAGGDHDDRVLIDA